MANSVLLGLYRQNWDFWVLYRAHTFQIKQLTGASFPRRALEYINTSFVAMSDRGGHLIWLFNRIYRRRLGGRMSCVQCIVDKVVCLNLPNGLMTIWERLWAVCLLVVQM